MLNRLLDLLKRPRTTAPATCLLIFATLGTDDVPPTAAPVPERPAHITFLSVPDGATVRLNGQVLGSTTPIEFQQVAPGISLVEFEKEGYETLRIQQFWASGAAARLDVILRPLATPTWEPTSTSRPTSTPRATSTAAPAYPRVGAPPPAVRVTLPPTAKAPKGTPTAKALKGTPTAQAATPTAGRMATVSLISQPPGAQVLLNGTALEGVTPIEKLALPAGKVSLEFRLANYEPRALKRGIL